MSATTNSSCKRKGCKVIVLPTMGIKDPCKEAKEPWYVDMKKKIKKPKKPKYSYATLDKRYLIAA